MLSAVVLAAGSSSRMGTDNKLLLPYKNKPVIAAVVETIINAGIKDVIVVTGYEADHIKDALKNFEVQFTHNQHYADGMTSSIKQGIMAAKGNGYMICLSDMVMITAADYKLLSDAFQKRISLNLQCIIMPWYKNKHGNPVIFSSFYKEMILQNLQPEGCKNIIQSNLQHLYMIEMATPHVLQDFDYPDDYKKLLQNHGLIF